MRRVLRRVLTRGAQEQRQIGESLDATGVCV